MSQPRSPEQKRFRRHISKSTGACALCGQRAAGGQALEWLDPLNLERGTILFLVCPGCVYVNFTEQLNRLHRETWSARHAHDQR